jgi:type II secretion system protein N
MSPSRLLSRTGVGALALLLFLFLTLLFVPASVLQDAATKALARNGLILAAGSFTKQFPLGIKGSELTLQGTAGTVLALDRFGARLEILPLLRGKVTISFQGAIGAGSISGRYSPGRDNKLVMDWEGIALEKIPFFSTVAGARVKGLLKGKAAINGQGNKLGGELQLDVQEADLRGISIGETALPDAAYRTVQGMVRINSGTARLESFTLQGDDLYIRLKGTLPLSEPFAASPLDLVLELMPKPEFLTKQKFVFLLLTKYLDTPGHYQIPIKGSLGKPLIQ